MMGDQIKKCYFCGTDSLFMPYYDDDLVFYDCPVCGRYELRILYNGPIDIDINKTSSYFFYHKYISNECDCKYHTMRSKYDCDKYNIEYDNGNNIIGRPVHFDRDIVNSWYPKNFDERIEYILNYCGENIFHVGDCVNFSYQEMLSLLFVDRFETKKFSVKKEMVNRDRNNCVNESGYMLKALSNMNLIKYSYGSSDDNALSIQLTPSGYSRLDDIQKNNSNGKNVLVAMKFGDETIRLREAIRQGIMKAGYYPIFIDEVQHNDFITPELLKHIKDSRFVVAELTHKNNGAYFEEGYAMGLGKPVIQLCKKNTKLHFDIAQKNTIIWETEDDIVEKLANRISATIE